jgi:hypothetical protein
MSLHGSRILMILLRPPGIARVMVTDFLTGQGAGETRTVTRNLLIVVEIGLMIKAIVGGIEKDVRSVTQSGWMSLPTKRSKPTLRKTFRNGKRG